jgi:hypothetical protein
LYGFRAGAGAEVHVFSSRSGKPLDRGRVRKILRNAAKQAGLDSPISPHWLRHAHASHALDHGAPIHLVQATLGHASVATTSAYLHARPGDSSSRFLSAETFLPKSDGVALPSERTRVMDVMEAASTAPGEKQMKTFTIDAENNITTYATRKEAREAGVPAFTTEEQFADVIGNDSKRLVEIWNSLPGVTPVKKFTNRKVATERIWKAIAAPGEPRVADAQPEAQTSAADSDVAPAEDQPSTTPSAAPEQLATVSAQETDVAPAEVRTGKQATRTKKPAKGLQGGKKAKVATGPRDGSKTAQVVAMLQRKGGATLAEIMLKFGWQRHTVRGFMAGAMKKAGFAVESFKPEGGERTYRINP